MSQAAKHVKKIDEEGYLAFPYCMFLVYYNADTQSVRVQTVFL
jgi:hypothetical protein